MFRHLSLPALAVAAATVLLSLSGPRAEEAASLEIGFMPILPVSQLFVGLGEGAISAGDDTAPDLVSFQNGPAMVQALLAGQLDVAYVGIGPAMVARAKGADIKVVAPAIVEQISMITLGGLTPYFTEGDPATAFARFAADTGRKAVITTFPVGSVPQTVLQYWIRKQLKADPDSLEVIYQGAAQVQQALLTGAVDGAAILEPIVAIALDRVDGATVVARGSDMFPGQPGAILAVRERLIADHPETVEKLVAAHIRATALLNEDPATAAIHVQKYVGGGRLDLGLVTQAIVNSRGSFVADPHAILDGTARMQDFQEEIGTLKGRIDLDALFDTSFYDRAVAQ